MATRKGPDDVFRITSAAPGLTDDQAGRQRRYLVSMAVRTACFLGAVVASGWLRWALVVGALVLPYLAVVIANAGRENGSPALDVVDGRTRISGADGGPGEPRIGT